MIWPMALSMKTECAKLSFCRQKGVGIEQPARSVKICMQFIHWLYGTRADFQIPGKLTGNRLRGRDDDDGKGDSEEEDDDESDSEGGIRGVAAR
mmetsp:Transcript_16423/g.33131  ORF Transcript_16423/g.33131 Transcript_16423/m.33131 type:complete len:94 (-) Transcript_16423:219-500(-)